ncbi:hypothetical protein DSO57_1038987 [Entomophthora muscae]|uniref:Uncharacterized protein n=1 Tax=Entomophthora muscae TaxID=34485 RepID=A0ACC2UJR7_9FUNG|nr:hypothetical protein DSO57_1038987 [Entomophthora muscae]
MSQSTHLHLTYGFDNAPQKMKHLCLPLFNVVLMTLHVVKSNSLLPALASSTLSHLSIGNH